MDRHLPIFSFFGWPLFVKGSCVANVFGMYGTTRCQIKDMDMVFPQVPLNPLLAKWFGYCDSMKYGSFERFFGFHFSDKILIQKLFSKLSQFKTNHPRDLKPIPNNHKWPKFSSDLRSTSVFYSIDEIFKN